MSEGTDITAAVYGDAPNGDAAAPADATPVDAGTTQAHGSTPAADAGSTDAKSDAKSAAPAGAPETYADFTAPDGFEIDKALLGEFTPTLKELNLTQDQAQKVMDFAPKLVTATVEKTTAAVMQAVGLADRDDWAQQVREDQEIGGDKLAENLALAKKALEAFGTPSLTAFLKSTQLGNHPDLIRAFVRAGKAIASDSASGGKQASASKASFYDKSNMNP